MDGMEEEAAVNGQTDRLSAPQTTPHNHTLGLHDLYKAAFSQEPSTEFNGDIVNANLIGDDSKENKAELVDEGYQLYTMKSMQFELPKDGVIRTVYGAGTMYQDVTTVLPYESEDTNSVLDLDKGIQIQVVKGAVEPNMMYHLQYQSYPGDSPLLHRYLCDIKSESNDLSSPSSGQDDSFHFLTTPNNNVLYDEKGVGISPDTLGVRFEDCDFNSSDSFASTESIIPKNIQCSKCPKKFMFKSDLMRHDKYKHNTKMKLVCQFCNKLFASQQNLQFHEKSHQKKPGNKCDTCKKNFRKVGFLVKHMLKKHSKSPLSCELCGMVFSTRSLLNCHTRKDHPESPGGDDSERPFKCSICDKAFTKKKGLNSHVKTHAESNAFTCLLCNKSFAKASYLRAHQKVHGCEDVDMLQVTPGLPAVSVLPAVPPVSTEPVMAIVRVPVPESPPTTVPAKKSDKPYTCDTCFKSFANKNYFKSHVRKHVEKKEHVCDTCSKEFLTLSELHKHERSHSKEKPYSCVNCNKTFTLQSHLVTHWRKQRCHSGQTQEIFTQTSELDLANSGELHTVQNVNFVVDPLTFSNQQPILVTSIEDFINSNSVPIIVPISATSNGGTYTLPTVPS